ncbi:serine threonine protein kinase [Stylonychia lemnae]|uniref:non-specific serine/threonine protein kinase n=1 Tax=Stylonychia lemnae TaxID=5949 RepID=A0A078ATY8_STYLE|nr:serine threonine protein kinase [Stylonychia lemnae]|eukprot:CDW84707.1 serine threonine protein kinase [Stylonychia lemnae]
MDKLISMKIRKPDYRYRIERCIKKGGFGTVYQVTDTEDPNQTQYAMKLQQLSKIMVANNKDTPIELQLLRLFREICTFQLKHPFITEVKESFLTDDGHFVMIQELAQCDLKAYLAELGQIDADQITELMIQIVNGLEYIHSHDIIHRDISPDNILVFDNDLFKICDFGVASFGQATLSQAGKINYLAPEAFKGEASCDKMCDIWSLGVLLLYLCTGQPTYRGQVVREFVENPYADDTIELPPQYERFELILNRMLAHDPKDRPQIKEIKRALLELQNIQRNASVHDDRIYSYLLHHNNGIFREHYKNLQILFSQFGHLRGGKYEKNIQAICVELINHSSYYLQVLSATNLNSYPVQRFFDKVKEKILMPYRNYNRQIPSQTDSQGLKLLKDKFQKELRQQRAIRQQKLNQDLVPAKRQWKSENEDQIQIANKQSNVQKYQDYSRNIEKDLHEQIRKIDIKEIEGERKVISHKFEVKGLRKVKQNNIKPFQSIFKSGKLISLNTSDGEYWDWDGDKIFKSRKFKDNSSCFHLEKNILFHAFGKNIGKQNPSTLEDIINPWEPVLKLSSKINRMIQYDEHKILAAGDDGLIVVFAHQSTNIKQEFNLPNSGPIFDICSVQGKSDNIFAFGTQNGIFIVMIIFNELDGVFEFFPENNQFESKLGCNCLIQVKQGIIAGSFYEKNSLLQSYIHILDVDQNGKRLKSFQFYGQCGIYSFPYSNYQILPYAIVKDRMQLYLIDLQCYEVNAILKSVYATRCNPQSLFIYKDNQYMNLGKTKYKIHDLTYRLGLEDYKGKARISDLEITFDHR